MKTLKKVEIQAVFVEFIPEQLEENKVYISEKYGVSVHNCLCGCGLKTVMPLGAGQWNFTLDDAGRVSFTPSISNSQYECKSHYIITKNVANFV